MLWLAVGVILLVSFGLIVLRGAPYVPTKRRNLEQAFTHLYQLTKDDLLLDIGSGDGVVLRAAATHGARAVGYELNPLLAGISWALAGHLRPLIQVRVRDFWLSQFPAKTTIVYTFGESRDIKRMYQKVQREATRLQRTLYFMSYGFSVPGQPVLKQDTSFYLYRVTPLHQGKAQV